MKISTFSKRLQELLDIKNIKPAELSRLTDINKGNISHYLKGDWQAKQDTIYKIANVFNLNEAWLIGYDVPMYKEATTTAIPENLQGIENIIPVPLGKRIPVIGSIACGTPILAQENIEGYITLNPEDKADFCLLCKGDSMLPRCQNGDLVLIRKQPTVENGEIAAVRIGDEATLKKVYRPAPDQLMLIAENADFPPIVLTKDEINTVSIEGKAIGFIRMF